MTNRIKKYQLVCILVGLSLIGSQLASAAPPIDKGNPFNALLESVNNLYSLIETLQIQINNIQLKEGPPGPQGPKGDPGPEGDSIVETNIKLWLSTQSGLFIELDTKLFVTKMLHFDADTDEIHDDTLYPGYPLFVHYARIHPIILKANIPGDIQSGTYGVWVGDSLNMGSWSQSSSSKIGTITIS